MFFNKIVITTDLSDSSRTAFDFASYERKMDGSEIILLNVFQYCEPPSELMDLWNPDIMVNFAEQYKVRASKILQEMAHTYFHGLEVRCEVIVSRQSPATEILNFVRKVNANLILMASLGETRLGGVSLGGTVERVLQKAECPVLVVPALQTKK